MIPERYSGMLPAYWYEIDMADRHFSVMEDEMELREQKIDELSDQFILPRATWSLFIWEWIYFRRKMNGSDSSRREAIRQKRWGNSPFRIPVLRDLGNQHGKLLEIKEDFINKVIELQFSTEEPIDQESLKRNFEYIRPVHIRSMTVSLKAPDWSSRIDISEHYSVLNYPFQAFASNALYAGVLYEGTKVATLPTPPLYSGEERIAQTYELVLQAAFPITSLLYAGSSGAIIPPTIRPNDQVVTYSSEETVSGSYETQLQVAYKLTGTINSGTEEII
ncbi:hypothetical protein [Paenibacillus wynnii]|uniref:hypothetical protein n=1 Tax=Paenibacillus wynnii TaxID=268407 RepID=UPI00068B3CB4|nr:hypothetical protein [Paenibacillus wynnii]